MLPRFETPFGSIFKFFSEKFLLSQKLRYFRGSRFSQCCTLSTALHCLLPRKFYAKKYLECKLPIVSSVFKDDSKRTTTFSPFFNDPLGRIYMEYIYSILFSDILFYNVLCMLYYFIFCSLTFHSKLMLQKFQGTQ